MNVPVSEIHDGYFAVDGKGNFKNSKEKSTLADESAFQAIMKNKEGLLTFYDEAKGNTLKSNKLRFLWSHSALKEGWDNPNVFQIATLIESKDTITKRQKIGRGLRIAVDQDGNRVYGFEVNRLTIMANESYHDFADSLQKEYEDDDILFGVFTDDIFATMIVSSDDSGQPKAFGKSKSAELIAELKDSGYIDGKGKAKDKLRQAIKKNEIALSDEFSPFSIEILEVARRHVKTLDIKNASEREKISYKQELLDEEFSELWQRINKKTKYSIEFDNNKFIDESIKAIKTLSVNKVKFIFERAKLGMTEAGVTIGKEAESTYTVSNQNYQLPDIVSFLQNETKLTRKTIVQILNGTGESFKKEFKRNPSQFMFEASKIINRLKEKFIVDGIKYELTGEEWEQSLFQNIDLYGYKGENGNIVATPSTKTPYDFTVVDSGIEEIFAKDAEKNNDVKFYIKLPDWFKIKTPLGSYNPDWALLKEEDSTQRLYFVVETK